MKLLHLFLAVLCSLACAAAARAGHDFTAFLLFLGAFLNVPLTFRP